MADKKPQKIEVVGANLKRNDGVMVLILREDGQTEVHFPVLGRLSEGKLEHSQMMMYRGLLQARAAEHRRLAAAEQES